jgi:hypothetical protein
MVLSLLEAAAAREEVLQDQGGHQPAGLGPRRGGGDGAVGGLDVNDDHLQRIECRTILHYVSESGSSKESTILRSTQKKRFPAGKS